MQYKLESLALETKPTGTQASNFQHIRDASASNNIDAASSGPRVLLNAESFGFGPSAAIASLAAELVSSCERISYIGGEHTLDLQKNSLYNATYDTTGMSDEERLARLKILAPHYDIFVTGMDFRMAKLALRAGMKIGIYDALTWYWPNLETVIREATPYIAQDFFGVKARVATDTLLQAHTVIVPPIIPMRRTWKAGNHILINLGGLENPFWKLDDAVAYVGLTLAAVRSSLLVEHGIVVATSRRISSAFDDPIVGTYDHETMLELMSTAAYALMTPGLGNIYDAAATGVPTLWLPPTNHTQAIQSHLLARHECCDARLDWVDIGISVDYSSSAYSVAQGIMGAVSRISASRHLQDLLGGHLALQTENLSGAPGKAKSLAEHFGRGSMEKVAAIILQWCN